MELFFLQSMKYVFDLISVLYNESDLFLLSF